MRIRTVKPEFWKNKPLARLPEFTRLMALALLNMADDEGYFAAEPELVRGDLFPFEQDLRKIQVALTELSGIDYLRLAQADDGRIYGMIVTFTVHQKISHSYASKIKGLASFTEHSVNAQGIFSLGMEQGMGSGAGKDAVAPAVEISATPSMPLLELTEEQQVSRARENNIRGIKRTMPPQLSTADFAAAWDRWTVHWSLTFNHGQAIPFATSDNHLKILNALGEKRAIAAIENSISRRLREPAEAFTSSHANHRQPNSRSFENMPDYTGVTDK